jgi:DNA-binding response OmpR family regulator
MLHLIKHICFADDDPDDQLIFLTIIKENFSSVHVDTFYHCNALITFLNNDQTPLPDMIFLDLNMPGNDGNACLQLLKATARLMNIPVVMYSTSAYEKDIVKSLKQGAYKYIVKPTSFKEIKERLEEVFFEYAAMNKDKQSLPQRSDKLN